MVETTCSLPYSLPISKLHINPDLASVIETEFGSLELTLHLKQIPGSFCEIASVFVLRQ